MKTKRITQYLHYLNATELGKSGTHETYLSISKDVDLSNIFPLGVDVAVEDIKSRKIYQLKSSDGNGNEFRVNKMGELYRDYSMMPGDLIVITHFDELNSKRTTISAITFNGVVLSVDSKGGELNNVERLSPFLSGEKQYSLEAVFNGNLSKLIITFVEAKKKRADSPIDTDYYEISVDGQKLANGKYYLIIGKENVLHVAKKYEYNTVFLEEPDELGKTHIQPGIKLSLQQPDNEAYTSLLTALRTKPFVLLAGISGTGKSQKVQELAFMTCPDGDLRNEGGTTPGNYCLVEVKPNWHDSTDLLGYYSALSGKYELTDFIRFVYKAIQHRNVPFFLCLDEMNLAPVEQYFAEFLSVLETRKKVGDSIQTQYLLSKDRFSNCELKTREPKKRNAYNVIDDQPEYDEKPLYSEADAEIICYLKENGLTLPDNLFVIGTVNMDDTTHQFSRKVIDRAFTIEMNGGKMADMFGAENRAALEYREKPVGLYEFKSQFVRAYEVLEDGRFAKYADIIKERIPALLGNSDGTAATDSINGILNNTPFRVSYRVQNELIIYLSTLIERAEFPEDIDGLISEAILTILLEKILPRVQGEQKQLETKKDGKNSNILKDLKSFVERHFKPAEDTPDALYNQVVSKLDEMDRKLDNYYTNFF